MNKQTFSQDKSFSKTRFILTLILLIFVLAVSLVTGYLYSQKDLYPQVAKQTQPYLKRVLASADNLLQDINEPEITFDTDPQPKTNLSPTPTTEPKNPANNQDNHNDPSTTPDSDNTNPDSNTNTPDNQIANDQTDMNNSPDTSDSDDVTHEPIPTPTTQESNHPEPTQPPLAPTNVTYDIDLKREGAAVPDGSGQVTMTINETTESGFILFEATGNLNNLKPNQQYEVWFCGASNSCSNQANPVIVTDGSGNTNFTIKNLSHNQGLYPLEHVSVWEVPPPGEIIHTDTTYYPTSDAPCLEGNVHLN